MAAKMYQKYVSKPHEDNKNAYCNMGLCYFKDQRYEECIEACKQALRIDENYAKVYYRLALAYDKIDNEYQNISVSRMLTNFAESTRRTKLLRTTKK